MKIAIRTDASNEIGTGHVIRCRTLAFELRQRGAKIRFLCRARDGHLIHPLRSSGFDVDELPVSSNLESKLDDSDPYAAWLGVRQAEDAAQVLDGLSDWSPDWMIVDHYGLDAVWEGALRAHTKRIMAIDDLANRQHDCDLLLDQNHTINQETRYLDRVAATCRLLLGPRYALLDPAYIARRAELGPRSGAIRSILVFLGGSDARDGTGVALEALSAPELSGIALDVVVGANYPFRARLAEKVAVRGNATLRGPLPTLVDAMTNADLAIGAGGGTNWERLCLGLPSVVVSIADNQQPASVALARDGLAVYAGDIDTISASTLRSLLAGLLADAAEIRRMSQAGMALVDGQGVFRVADAISEAM